MLTDYQYLALSLIVFCSNAIYYKVTAVLDLDGEKGNREILLYFLIIFVHKVFHSYHRFSPLEI